jgi:hypothetical protein
VLGRQVGGKAPRISKRKSTCAGRLAHVTTGHRHRHTDTLSCHKAFLACDGASLYKQVLMFCGPAWPYDGHGYPELPLMLGMHSCMSTRSNLNADTEILLKDFKLSGYSDIATHVLSGLGL